MTTFKEYLAPHVADIYDFVVLRDQAIAERQTVLVPIKFCHIPVLKVLNHQTQSETVIPVYQPDERDDFLSMVHVALKLPSDILGKPTHQGLNVCKEDAIAYVPESLYMFRRLMLGGQCLLENGLSDCDDDDKDGEGDVNDEDDDHDKEESRISMKMSKRNGSNNQSQIAHRL